MWYSRVTKPVKDTAFHLKEDHPAAVDMYNQFVSEHGQIAADIITLIRAPGSIAILVATLQEKYGLAAVMKMLSIAGDKVDGTFGKGYRKYHPEAVRTWVSKHEDLFDKMQSAASQIGLAKKGRLNVIHPAVRIPRDIAATVERAGYLQKGVDVDAIKSGKASTGIVEVADTIATLAGSTPILAVVATVAKGLSYRDSRNTWKRRLEEKDNVDAVKAYFRQNLPQNTE
jgi:hypothetical protein